MRVPFRSRRRRRGASLVEFACVFPLLLTLILGMVEMARLGLVLQLLTTAARDGCRVAVVYERTQADVQARVDSILHGTGINVGTVNPTPSSWLTAPIGTPITVRLSVPYRQVTWLPVPRFLGNLNVTATATLSSERP